jgi:hypothetical protein
MNPPAASLIQAAAQADRAAPPFSFFSDVQEEAEKSLAAAGEFTGERLHRDRPAIYAAAVRMIAEGQSISAAARALGISRNTVCAVRDREGVSIEQDKKELLRDLRRASRLGVEKVIELLPETKAAKDAAIVAAVMVDKMQLLGGEATSRVERVDVKPDQVKAYLDALPVLDAELVEISMGVPGEAAGQKAAGLEAAAPALLVASSDVRSDVAGHGNTDAEEDETTLGATAGSFEPAPDAEDDAAGRAGEGGGGGALCSAMAARGIDTETQNFGQKPNAGRPAARVPALGDGDAGESLCKRTNKTKKGGAKATAKQRARSSQKVRISQKKKGGSGC